MLLLLTVTATAVAGVAALVSKLLSTLRRRHRVLQQHTAVGGRVSGRQRHSYTAGWQQQSRHIWKMSTLDNSVITQRGSHHGVAPDYCFITMTGWQTLKHSTVKYSNSLPVKVAKTT